MFEADDVTHRFSVGQDVYFESKFGLHAARGQYKVVRVLPVERDNRLQYRIKSAAETFERTVEEEQLSAAHAADDSPQRHFT